MTSLEAPPAAVVDNVLGQRTGLSLSARLLDYLGVWPISNEPKSFVGYYRHYLLGVLLLRVSYTIIFNFISMYIIWGDLPTMVQFTTMIVFNVNELTRTYSLYFNGDNIRQIFLTLDKLCDPDTSVRKYLEKVTGKTNRMLYKMTHLGLRLAIIGSVFLIICLTVVGFRERIIPLRLWLPYDYSSTPIFEISLLTINTLNIFDCFMIFFPTTLYLSFIIHLIAQYKILRYKIKNLKDIVEEKLEYSRESNSGMATITDDFGDVEDCVQEISGSEETQNSDNVEVVSVKVANDEQKGRVFRQTRHALVLGQLNRDLGRNAISVIQTNDAAVMEDTTYNAQWEEAATESNILRNIEHVVDLTEELPVTSVHLKPHEEGMMVPENLQSEYIDDNLEMEKFLKCCAQHHQTILSLTKDVQKVFKVSLNSTTYVLSLAGLVALYITTLAPEFDIMVGVVTVILGGAGIEFFLLCWFGNSLSIESEKLREAIYGCEWYGASESFKRSIRIMISRTNKPEVLKAGGLPLSVKSFRFMYKTGYYLHNVLVKILHGTKINDMMS